MSMSYFLLLLLVIQHHSAQGGSALGRDASLPPYIHT